MTGGGGGGGDGSLDKRVEKPRAPHPPLHETLLIDSGNFAISGGSGDAEYVHSPVGLFPVPLGPSTRFSVVEEICSKFRFLGKLMAKAIMDSRMVCQGQP